MGNRITNQGGTNHEGIEKKNYGKVSMGVVRTTYLIDEEGMIVKAFGKVKAAENPGQMLLELQNL